MRTIEDDIICAAEVLTQGGIIAYPTDTIWGLGCDARNEEAVQRLISLKGRKPDKGIIALVASREQLSELTGRQNIQKSDRPTTYIYPTATLAPSMLANDGSAAIRITEEKISKRLCGLFGGPIASTSANFSSQPSPATFSQISANLLEMLDYVMENGRDNPPGRPSRIIKIATDGKEITLRP